MAVRSVLRVVVPAAEAELAADLLWQHGPSAVASDDLDGGLVALTADVADPAALRLPWPAEVVLVDDGAALDAWRPHARPRRAGRRLLLQPTWLPDESRPGDLVVRLDPGHAFGSGSHPSTRLVLAALEDHLCGGEAVLDVGSGSGVLSVAACLLGAARAAAVDLDPAAVAATQANAAINGVSGRVEASATPLQDLDGTFDVVVANIGGRALRELRGGLLARCAPGALVALAGFLDHQAAEVASAYAPPLAEVERRSEDGWTVLTLRG